MPLPIFDAHLDLAYLAECGRDMTSADLATCGGKHAPAAVTFPSLRAGHIAACLGTIFTEAVPDPAADHAETGPFSYPLGDAQAAHRAGLRQLEHYHRWQRDGLIELMPRRGQVASPSPHFGSAKTGEGRGEGRGMVPGSADSTAPAPLRVGILMECADPIRTPDELPFWVDRGVIAIGMAWVHGGRYAAGNGASPDDPSAGLSDLGRALIPAMDALGVVHDVSHLSQRATDQLLELTDARLMASHSNCRALFDRDPYPNARQRHLADSTIREIARRGGMIGLNLLSDFLDPAIQRGQRATIQAAIRHLDHLCEVVGHRGAIGLGTDMDGGFGADRLPVGISRPADLAFLFDQLGTQGWSTPEVRGLASGNWERFWDVPARPVASRNPPP